MYHSKTVHERPSSGHKRTPKYQKSSAKEPVSFKDLGLEPSLLNAVKAEGYTTPTPIQAKAIPVALEGRDVLGGAQTGTGKTAAFVLPLLQKLARPEGKGCNPRALILTPTRELAEQVFQSIRKYGQNYKLFSAVIIGGVGMGPQIKALRQGMDILVATPGRLLDHLGRNNLTLKNIDTFVLDEADRMLDMGFIPDIRKIAEKLPMNRQTLFFSATYTKEIRKLANELLDYPISVDVTPRNSAAATVRHIVHPVTKQKKRDLIVHLIRENNWYRILVFTRTKHGADRLAKQLVKEGLSSASIHGDKSQSARTRTLREFKQGKIQTLVATDIAARGLDIDDLPHVINFDLPNVPEDYIHRIGRTGRAGNEGLASSLVSADERSYLRQIEVLLKRQIDIQHIPGFDIDEQDTRPLKGKHYSGHRSGTWRTQKEYQTSRGRRK